MKRPIGSFNTCISAAPGLSTTNRGSQGSSDLSFPHGGVVVPSTEIIRRVQLKSFSAIVIFPVIFISTRWGTCLKSMSRMSLFSLINTQTHLVTICEVDVDEILGIVNIFEAIEGSAHG